jgi:isoleucyl-tRNA synthetase
MSQRFPDLPDTVALETEVLEFWKSQRIFEKSLEEGRRRPRFTFYEGPPTANGLPHNGHVLTRVIKDLVPRYRTMRGFHVERKGGWDTHGLPVEIEVEKSLGVHGRQAIMEYGLERFNRQCMRSVFTYVNEWEQLTERIGFWLDTRQAYATFHRSYVESVWWALSQLYKKGLLYQGHKVVWWWPQGGTALSAGEVGGGYKTVEDPSITIRFAVQDQPGLFLLAWTTTPWTLPSNVALAVKPDASYAFVRVGDETLILEEHLAAGLGGTVEKLVPGAELVGMRYVPLYSWGTPQNGRAWVVIPADFVTLDTGTGIVHIAPAFGEDDFRAGQEQGLGFLCLVEPDGRFTKGTDFVEGRFCKACDRDILQDLKERGILFKAETVRHEYPFCPRRDDEPLIQYARPAWFIRTTARNAEALANNAAVNWIPEHIKEGRFGDFLRNNVDWALSRERFWGTPLNIWLCERCQHPFAPESVAELLAHSDDALDESVDPNLQVHRPWIDRVTARCERCGGTMRRVPEVIDCWFDAGCMPFAQHGWPHQNHEAFKASFPADFISEAVDQTRGWFYALLMISTLLFDEETCARYELPVEGYPHSFRNCLVLGHVCDTEGHKESKSKGNYVPPDLVIRGRVRFHARLDPSLRKGCLGMVEAQVRSLDLASNEKIRVTAAEEGEGMELSVVKARVGAKETVLLHPDDASALGIADGADLYLHAPFEPPGADAFRWLFYAASPAWTNTRLSMRAIREGQREFLLKLRNVHQFFVIYANIADFDPTRPAARHPSQRSLLDRWILGEFCAIQRRVTDHLDRYQIYDAARALLEFVDSLSNWYVRRSRNRFWGEGPDLDDALRTLYEVLVDLSRLIAPFVPFFADALYRALVVAPGVGWHESVHLCAWPETDARLLDPALSEEMALVRELANLGRAAREKVGVRVRQPLSAIEVVLADPSLEERLRPLAPLLLAELNVREIRFAQDAERFVSFKVKPNYRALGARLGKDMKACAAALAAMPGGEVRRQVLAGGLSLDLPSGRVVLGGDDLLVEVEPRAHFEAAGSALAVVALHRDLDEDLVEEGLAREVVNRVQILRKTLRLGYTDRIRLGIAGDERLLAATRRFQDYLCGETLTVELGEPEGEVTQDDVDGMRLSLSLSVVARA